MDTLSLLKELEAGTRSYSEVLQMIRNPLPPIPAQSSGKYARKLKIRICDEGKTIPIPGLPFWFVKLGSRISLKFIAKYHKPEKNANYNLKEIFPYIHEAIDTLSNYPPFELVSIEDRVDHSLVFIETK